MFRLGGLGITATQAVLISGVVFGAAFVQSAAGFGFSLLAVPLLALMVPPSTAVIAALCLSLLINVGMLTQVRSHADLGEARRLSLAAALAMPFGVLLLLNAPAGALRILVGAVSGAAAIWLLCGARGGQHLTGRFAGWIAGGISGVLNTSTSANGPPLVVYLRARRLSPEAFRATMAIVLVVSGVIGLTLLGLAGAIHGGAGALVLWTLVPSAAGLGCGRLIARRLKAPHFTVLVDLLLLMSGLAAIAKSLAG